MQVTAATLDADLELAAARAGRIDLSARAQADAPLLPGGELPFEDGALASLQIGDALLAWSPRDRLQLMLDCRRVLAAGAVLRPVEPRAGEVCAAFARWAGLAGLVELPPHLGLGWAKRQPPAVPVPLVTVAIPSSNPRYFLECLDSAIAQTYPRIEIVICDDSEQDVIAQMAASRAGRADIRFERNPVRLRTRRNYERLLALARGEFVKFLNDDDVLEPTCVATLARAFEQVPDLALATSNRLRIDAASNPLADMPATRPAVTQDVVVDGVSLANAVIMHGLNFIGEPSTGLFRKRDFDPRPGIDGERPFHFNGEEVRGAIDLAMWSRLLLQGNAAFFAQRLSRFRVHGEQAQAHADVMARSIDGIRGLQHQWIELGLFRRWPPHVLMVRSLPEAGDPTDEWRLERVLSLPGPDEPPEEAVRSWQAMRRHPFDFAADAG